MLFFVCEKFSSKLMWLNLLGNFYTNFLVLAIHICDTLCKHFFEKIFHKIRNFKIRMDTPIIGSDTRPYFGIFLNKIFSEISCWADDRTSYASLFLSENRKNIRKITFTKFGFERKNGPFLEHFFTLFFCFFRPTFFQKNVF